MEPKDPKYPNGINLYRFIKRVMGEDTSGRTIARIWGVDEKYISSLKQGASPVPDRDRLEALARVLGINKYLIFEVASGLDAEEASAMAQERDPEKLWEGLYERLDGRYMC